jgi:hypothetical protein
VEPAIRELLVRSKAMLNGIAVVAMGMHGYDGPGAMAITLAVPVLAVLILVGVYGRKKR